uniref:Uncharacterized protein n=1 Tax=Arundo donax TaxID=35708 RepID=A0A0A9A567_ARUDO
MTSSQVFFITSQRCTVEGIIPVTCSTPLQIHEE